MPGCRPTPPSAVRSPCLFLPYQLAGKGTYKKSEHGCKEGELSLHSNKKWFFSSLENKNALKHHKKKTKSPPQENWGPKAGRRRPPNFCSSYPWKKRAHQGGGKNKMEKKKRCDDPAQEPRRSEFRPRSPPGPTASLLETSSRVRFDMFQIKKEK